MAMNTYTVTYSVTVSAKNEKEAIKKANGLVACAKAKPEIELTELGEIPADATGWLVETREPDSNKWWESCIISDYDFVFADDDTYEEYLENDCHIGFFANYPEAYIPPELDLPDYPGFCYDHPCDCSGWDVNTERYYRIRKVKLGPISEDARKFLASHKGKVRLNKI